jgi:hypothetical protein
MALKRLVLLFCFICISFPILAKQSGAPSTAVTTDPQAVALAVQALAAISGSAKVTDITLTGTATRTAGSDVENGNFTLKALGTDESRLDLNLVAGLSSEIRNVASGAPQGFLISPSAVESNMAQHNCLTSAAWFFPGLSILSQTADPAVAVTFVGQETKLDTVVNHIRFKIQSASLSASDNARLAQLSQTDFYLNSSSNLPVAMVFNAHPDSDAVTNINVEVDFTNYQTVNGVQVPFRIQKFVNGTLFLDLTVQNAVLNSGLTSSAFASN